MSGDIDKFIRSFEEWANSIAGTGVLTVSGLRDWEERLRNVLTKWRQEWADSEEASIAEPVFPAGMDEGGNFSLNAGEKV